MRCGSPTSPGTDIITQYGRAVTPDNVKDIFGYPRPQMARPRWHSLNGLWEFTADWSDCKGAANCDGAKPPFGKTLNQTVLVPFPVESCLSGLENATLPGTPPTYQHMVYRTLVDGAGLLAELQEHEQLRGAEHAISGEVLLHFGAVDWQVQVYVNGLWVGSHEGGYDSFSFDIAAPLAEHSPGTPSEILVVAHDPSNFGNQPFGKQRTSAMWRPAGDTYSPNSGIWQPVWLEVVPSAHINALKLTPNTTHLNVKVLTSLPELHGETPVVVEVLDGTQVVASTADYPNSPLSIEIPDPKLWSPEHPFLYNLKVAYGSDSVGSYFGMREVSVCTDPGGVVRPCINGEYRFLSGVLDQGFWSDGIYLAPGDEALVSDLLKVKDLGQNFIRKHQKVESERWYYHTDRLGILVAQDVVQHYGDGVQGPGTEYQSNNGGARARYYWQDLKALIDGRSNHPSIFQYETFNEQDMVYDFDASRVVQWVQSYDPTRLVDTDSGGPANDLHVGDVDDLHVGEPSANNPHKPGARQYMFDAEVTPDVNFWTDGHTWTDSSDRTEVCRMYAAPDAKHPVVPSGMPHVMALRIASMSSKAKATGNLSAFGYTCLHDTEMECDGIFNYDRTPKFGADAIALIRKANKDLIGSPVKCMPLMPLDELVIV